MTVRKMLGAIFALVLAGAPAQAAVTMSFYAHQLGSKGVWVEFPHAYVVLTGTPDAGGPAVKANFGFTPPVVGPSILFGRVEGEVDSVDDAYIAKDTPYLTMPLTDRQYTAVLAVVKRWRDYPQPSYDLDTHDCVIFVRDIAEAVGLKASEDVRFVRDPAAFMADLRTQNMALAATPSGRVAGTAKTGTATAASQ